MEAELGLRLARSLVRGAGRTEAELFGGTLDPVRASHLLSGTDRFPEGDPQAIRRLRTAVLLALLRPHAGGNDEEVPGRLLLEAAEILQSGDAERAEYLRLTLEQWARPRPQPPVFTVPDRPRGKASAARAGDSRPVDRVVAETEAATAATTRAAGEAEAETDAVAEAEAEVETRAAAETDAVAEAETRAAAETDAVAEAEAEVESRAAAETEAGELAERLQPARRNAPAPVAEFETPGPEASLPADHSEEPDPPQPQDPVPTPTPLRVVKWEVGLPASSDVRVTLHGATGQEVLVLFDGTLEAGVHHCEAGVPAEILREIGPLGYVRLELPGGRWQQGIFLPG